MGILQQPTFNLSTQRQRWLYQNQFFSIRMQTQTLTDGIKTNSRLNIPINIRIIRRRSPIIKQERRGALIVQKTNIQLLTFNVRLTCLNNISQSSWLHLFAEYSHISKSVID